MSSSSNHDPSFLINHFITPSAITTGIENLLTIYPSPQEDEHSSHAFDPLVVLTEYEDQTYDPINRSINRHQSSGNQSDDSVSDSITDMPMDFSFSGIASAVSANLNRLDDDDDDDDNNDVEDTEKNNNDGKNSNDDDKVQQRQSIPYTITPNGEFSFPITIGLQSATNVTNHNSYQSLSSSLLSTVITDQIALASSSFPNLSSQSQNDANATSAAAAAIRALFQNNFIVDRSNSNNINTSSINAMFPINVSASASVSTASTNTATPTITTATNNDATGKKKNNNGLYSLKNYKEHYNKIRSPELGTQFICKLCNFRAKSQITLIRHLWTELGYREFRCEIEGCNRRFDNEFSRYKHRKFDHSHPQQQQLVNQHQQNSSTTVSTQAPPSDVRLSTSISTILANMDSTKQDLNSHQQHNFIKGDNNLTNRSLLPPLTSFVPSSTLIPMVPITTTISNNNLNITANNRHSNHLSSYNSIAAALAMFNNNDNNNNSQTSQHLPLSLQLSTSTTTTTSSINTLSSISSTISQYLPTNHHIYLPTSAGDNIFTTPALITNNNTNQNLKLPSSTTITTTSIINPSSIFALSTISSSSTTFTDSTTTTITNPNSQVIPQLQLSSSSPSIAAASTYNSSSIMPPIINTSTISLNNRSNSNNISTRRRYSSQSLGETSSSSSLSSTNNTNNIHDYQEPSSPSIGMNSSLISILTAPSVASVQNNNNNGTTTTNSYNTIQVNN